MTARALWPPSPWAAARPCSRSLRATGCCALARPSRVLFLVDRVSLGDQAKKEFLSFVSARTTGGASATSSGFRYSSAPTASSVRRTSSSAPSSACTRCCAATMMMSSMRTLKRRHPVRARRRRPTHRGRLQRRHPGRVLRPHVRRRVPSLHLRTLGPGHRLLRRLRRRADRDPDANHARLLRRQRHRRIQPGAVGL